MTGEWENPKTEEFIDWLKSQGASKIRLFINRRKSLTLSVGRQSLKGSEYGDTKLYFVEALWRGEYACAYIDSLEDREEILKSLDETSGVFTDRTITGKIEESRDFRGQRWREADCKEVTEVLCLAKREALACEKADFVEICEYRQYEDTITLIDENMNYLSDDDGDCSFFIRVIARDEGFVSAASKFGLANAGDREAFQETAVRLARCAAEYARFGLHAGKLSSGSYPVVIENCVMAELTGYYLPVFYGENLKNHTSALAGKEKKQVGCPFLEISEDPFSSQGTRRRRIDDEGVPVSKKTLLKGGVFQDILYNKKSAAEAGAESTGNGFKPSLTADIGTSATNVILSSEGGTFSRKEMLEASEGGIYITQADGIFAGADTESGDFSLLASGNLITDGKVAGAVHQFTISGNICELWRDIEMIGDDPVYRLSDDVCAVSPTVKVKSLMVSGE